MGHDVLTTFESGRAGQAIPDEEVVAFAMAGERIVVTLNRRHFVRLHQTTPDHAGIVVCSFDPDFAALAQRIHAALGTEPQMEDNDYVSIGRQGDRYALCTHRAVSSLAPNGQ